MTDKERLEEIRHYYREMESFDPGTQSDINWLIEQAEQKKALEATVDFYQSALRDADRRVQELEDLVEDYITINKELHKRGKKVRKQNKRYREALEEIIHLEQLKETNVFGYDNEDITSYVETVARKALEGES